MANIVYFLGIVGVEFIWHGEWADPELKYENLIANYWDVDDSLWEIFKDETGSDDESEFIEWCKAHPETVKNEVEIFGKDVNEC